MYILGIDIGGTKTAVVLGEVRKEIHIIQKIRFDTETEKGFAFAKDNIWNAIQTLLNECAGEGKNVKAVGISCGGPLDSETGTILSPPNLPGWDQIAICRMIQDDFGLPAYLQNDANACALVEWKMGAGTGSRNMVFLTMGTGFGAGLICGGRLVTGTNDMAGEIGHIRLAPDGPVGFGKSGSVEGFCSGGGIGQLAEKALGQGSVTAKELFERAREGEPGAINIVETISEKLGEALSLIIDMLNPDTIVIGSIFQRAETLIRPKMEEVIERETLCRSRNVCKIVPAATKDDIGDYAAVLTAVYGIDPDFSLQGDNAAPNAASLAVYRELFQRYPSLENRREEIFEAYELLTGCYRRNGKVLVCGNGGSAADAEHIVGELMKGFCRKREISMDFMDQLKAVSPEKGGGIGQKLQIPLRALALTGQVALTTAFSNDVESANIFAQQVLGYADRGDVLICLSTSGNSRNVVNAAIVGKAMGLQVIALTGERDGELWRYSDVIIGVSGHSTPEIQELHLPVYHALCRMVEAEFFTE